VRFETQKQQARLVSRIRRQIAGEPQPRSGRERAQPDDVTRWLQQQFEETKKRFPNSPEDSGNFLRSALQRRKTFWRNRNRDLTQEIENATSIVSERSAPPTDAELEALMQEEPQPERNRAGCFRRRDRAERYAAWRLPPRNAMNRFGSNALPGAVWYL